MNRIACGVSENSEVVISEESPVILDEIADLEDFEDQEINVIIVPLNEEINND